MVKLPMRHAAPRYITVRRRVERLLRLLKGHDEAIILTHNDPDPDGISAAWGLSWLIRQRTNMRVRVVYSGMIGRAENRAMVRLLDVPLQHADIYDFNPETPVILVDAQPGSQNNILPSTIKPLAVIDHHPSLSETPAAAFREIESRFGATATIVTRYMWAMNVEPPPPLATALFYGIKTDTLGLSRGASRADAMAYIYLHERADLPLIGAIERAKLSRDYFVVMDRALRAARLFDDVIVTTLGEMQHADMAAEVADLLMRMQGVRWCFCVGTYQKLLILSLRTDAPDLNAGRMIQKLVETKGAAGGHSEMAGGRIPYKGGKRAAQQKMIDRFLALVKAAPEDGEPLLSR